MNEQNKLDLIKVRERKEFVEHEIRRLLNEFENDFPVHISYISLDSSQLVSGREFTTAVNITLDLQFDKT